MAANLPSEFNPTDIEAFLAPRLSESNTKACVRVIRKLISGEGVTHKAKPGEVFLKGKCVVPTDDIEELKMRATEWLPHSGIGALDKGHAWALDHPLQKLIKFKKHYLLGEKEETLKGGISKTKRTSKKKCVASARPSTTNTHWRFNDEGVAIEVTVTAV